jgi:hypothetical protein
MNVLRLLSIRVDRQSDRVHSQAQFTLIHHIATLFHHLGDPAETARNRFNLAIAEISA